MNDEPQIAGSDAMNEPQPQQASDSDPGASIWMLAIMQCLIAMAIVTVGLVLYTNFFAPKRISFGYVDIKTVVDTGQLKFTSKITDVNATDDDRAKAYDFAAAFGRDLSKTLDAVQQQCECVLMTKAAMIVGGDAATDYTPQVLKALNLEGLDIAAMQTKIVSEFSRSAASPASSPIATPGTASPLTPAPSSIFGVPSNAK